MESTIPVKLLKFPNIETAFRFILWVATKKKISNDRAADLLIELAASDRAKLLSLQKQFIQSRG
jgi:hypothetical protein